MTEPWGPTYHCSANPVTGARMRPSSVVEATRNASTPILRRQTLDRMRVTRGDMELKDYIRGIPDFPSVGVLFRDITPLLKAPAAFQDAMQRFAEQYESQEFDCIVGIEARGFLLAAPLAYRMGKPLVPVRKEGKLPYETHTVTYALEYGSDAVQVHTDAIRSGERALIVDDLLATGGTMAAAARLVEATGGQVAGLAVLVELTDLNGRARLRGYEVFSLIKY